MRIPNLTRDVAFAAVQLVDQNRPPSHDKLSRLIAGVGLAAVDSGTGVGKVKRMRAVMDQAMTREREAGARLVSRRLVPRAGAPCESRHRPYRERKACLLDPSPLRQRSAL